MDGLKHLRAGEGFLSWLRYRRVYEIYKQIVQPTEHVDRRQFDAFAQCSARIAVVLGVSQAAGETMMGEAAAMAERLPKVGECLRDGRIIPSMFVMVVSRTEPLAGMDCAALADEETAEALRRPGTWTRRQVHDLGSI